MNGPTRVGRQFNSFDLRTDELENGNLLASDRYNNLAINANTTNQVSHREVDIPENVTGGQCDSSTVYSHHDDDATDSNPVPVSTNQAVLNDDSVCSHHGDDVTDSNPVPVSTNQAVLDDDSICSHHGDDVTDSNQVDGHVTSLHCYHDVMLACSVLGRMSDLIHYNDVIMSAMTSQITSVSIVCSTIC